MAQTFECPSCGAPLEYTNNNEAVITCAYCKESVIVPKEILEAATNAELIKALEQMETAAKRPAPVRVEKIPTRPAARDASSIISILGATIGIAVAIIVPVALAINSTISVNNKNATSQADNATSRAQNNLTATARAENSTATAQARTATASVQSASATAAAQAKTATQTFINAAATTQAEVTATAISNTLNVQKRWAVVAADNFDNNFSGWPTGENTSSFAKVSRSVAKSKYRWELSAIQGFFSNTTPRTNKIYTTLYASVTVQQLTGPKSSDFGLVVRQSNTGSDGYYFGISEDGTFSFAALVQENWVTLIRSTPSIAIRAGAANQLTVSAEGTHFILLINNQVVGVTDNSLLKQGQVGVGVSLDRAGDEAIIEFSNYEVRAP